MKFKNKIYNTVNIILFTIYVIWFIVGIFLFGFDINIMNGLIFYILFSVFIGILYFWKADKIEEWLNKE